MQDRVQKTKEEVQKAKEKYEAALQEINQYNPKYMEDMSQVFDKCQEMEAQRLQFFKEVLFGIHKCLNISQDPVLVFFMIFFLFLYEKIIVTYCYFFHGLVSVHLFFCLGFHKYTKNSTILLTMQITKRILNGGLIIMV